MFEFSFLKAFKVDIHPTKAPIIKEAIWPPPILNWIKGNTNDTSINNSHVADAGGIFRDVEGVCLSCFAHNLGPGSALFA